MKHLKKILTFFVFSCVTLGIHADNYIAVDKNGKVFDEANTKYVTLNQNNAEVAVLPGMVFKSLEKSPGWTMIEYSPGLRAFIQENIISSSLNSPTPGTYDVKNLPGQKLTAEQNGEEWKGTVSGKTYNGKKYGEIVIFVDDSNQPAYSLVDLGSGTIVMSYDNSVTNFF